MLTILSEKNVLDYVNHNISVAILCKITPWLVELHEVRSCTDNATVYFRERWNIGCLGFS